LAAALLHKYYTSQPCLIFKKI